jgi:hypothetical protein
MKSSTTGFPLLVTLIRLLLGTSVDLALYSIVTVTLLPLHEYFCMENRLGAWLLQQITNDKRLPAYYITRNSAVNLNIVHSLRCTEIHKHTQPLLFKEISIIRQSLH